MFEGKTYEALLKSALSRVSSAVDKREGSMVMNGVAPSMAELAQPYIAADFVFTATYLATAPREYLVKRAADRNMEPKPASPAVFRAEFNYVDGLTRAELVELLIPGDDEEETEVFRQRVLDSFQSQAFGGNQADYKEKVLAMPGVGDVKLYGTGTYAQRSSSPARASRRGLRPL